jgi:hypothetical protein
MGRQHGDPTHATSWRSLNEIVASHHGHRTSATLIFAVTVAWFLPATSADARSLRMSGSGYHYVRRYTTNRGTYVVPHYQPNPNGTKLDNWSTKGNVNPFTGQPGTKNPY